MANAPRHTPAYEDQLVAWHNQRLWWLLCGAGGIIVTLTVLLAFLVFAPKSRPWVVEVDGKGEPVAGVEPLLGSANLTDLTTRWAVGQYIHDAFRISPSFTEEQTLLSRVYGMSTKQAGDALTAYYRGNKEKENPLKINGKLWQDIRVVRTLKLAPKDVYQVDYVVVRHDVGADPLNPTQTNWRATMRVIQGKPNDHNPLGLWIADLDFEPEAK